MKHGDEVEAEIFARPAAFRRLCVETLLRTWAIQVFTPAAFRRLCVETTIGVIANVEHCPSRLQAAVC